jgi:hypothetical protein
MRKLVQFRLSEDELDLIKRATVASGGEHYTTRGREVMLWWAYETLGLEKTTDLPPTPTVQ